ncbi:hypothetical protein [Acidiphilium acidophilum]|uniref:DUF2188 domain-containing protein n=1 Tax=Acidiphilium acidophilum TaxID=76588 RepID=A0AAW9DT13_ACIAO|nr:hypothetical protein [Acidiphilium acidophilum]MDX5932336.1 hypothetical protein [Acidiphilium acidophilum]GBQ11717.1 hypothetical protein AA700_1053 [Acidiphilium acidophilum DSM 700]
MPNWIVLRRDDDGVISKVDGLWAADDAQSAITRMCAETGKNDDGRWEAELPEDQEHVMNWALEAESRGLPEHREPATTTSSREDHHNG